MMIDKIITEMKNQGRIEELFAEDVKRLDKTVFKQTNTNKRLDQTNLRLDRTNEKLEEVNVRLGRVENEVFKRSLQTAENTRAIMKLAGERRARVRA